MAIIDTAATVRELETAGMERKQAQAVASAVIRGRIDLATKSDIDALNVRIDSLKWMVGILAAINLATLAGVIVIAFRAGNIG